MFISLCLNPSIDNAVYLDELRINTNNRYNSGLMTAGGKGINIARALKLYGSECKVLGFSGGFLGELLEGELEREDIDFDFLRTVAPTRMNIKLIEQKAENRFTEINSAGGPISAAEYTALVENLLEMLKNSPSSDRNYLFLSGSIPQGVEKSVYNYIIGEANKLGFKCIVDCDNTALEYAVQAKPYLIKPNKREFEMLAKKEFSTISDMKEYAKGIFDSFGTRVFCTYGREGSFYMGPEGVYDGNAVDITEHNPVGAGDVSLASFIYEFDRTGDIRASLDLAMAAGAATAETMGCNMPEKARIFELLQRLNGKV